ncbi:MAG: hypothetical protein KAS23_15445 [Anaerohalosphaera sp.]|nr:hypothetical protein [Anaerohalosphaera sp.]
MSTLTKILIVLLSFASIFLCSTAISYVASTRNVQETNKELKTLNQTIQADYMQKKNDFNTKSAEMKASEQQYLATIQELEGDKTSNAAILSSTMREKLDYETKYTELAASVSGINSSVGNLDVQLASTRVELEKQRNKNIATEKYLNEITSQLMAKTVELEALDKKSRRLMEDKVALENQLAGKDTIIAAKVTTLPESSANAVTTTPAKTVRGLVSEIGQTLVTVSVGSADGITKGTVLHVTRGDQFLCDIAITDVDTNKAVGIRQLVQAQPKIGDLVSTEL